VTELHGKTARDRKSLNEMVPRGGIADFNIEFFNTIGQFQNWQATCSLVWFDGFAKIMYKNSNSWGFHSLT